MSIFCVVSETYGRDTDQKSQNFIHLHLMLPLKVFLLNFSEILDIRNRKLQTLYLSRRALTD